MLKTPDWNHWGNMPRLSVWQAVALACNLDPNQGSDRGWLNDLRQKLCSGPAPGQSGPYAESRVFNDRCAVAEAHISAGKLELAATGHDILHHSLDIGEFARWAIDAVQWPVPPELEGLAAPSREGFAFDEEAETYPRLLDIACIAWRAVTKSPGAGTPKQRVTEWLEKHYKNELTGSQRETIAIVCNWNPGGGRPK